MAKSRKSNKAEIEAKIEYQEIIGEANEGGYQPIRFSRIKYKASPYTHIDIRKYQREEGYSDDDTEVEDKFHPTKLGFRFPEREFIRVIRAYTLMPQTYIHPEIYQKSFKLLNSEHFESAVLQAFKCIETKIRASTQSDPEDVGIKLIRKAFHSTTGPLTDYELPVSERDAFANYIAGAFGFYKNPCSHRDVDLDFISSFDRIVVASDLLKMVDRAVERISKQPSSKI